MNRNAITKLQKAEKHLIEIKNNELIVYLEDNNAEL